MPAPATGKDAVELADLHLRARRLDEAAAQYRRALEIRPGLAEAHSGLARLAAAWRARGAALKKEGKAEQALDALRKAFAAQPGHANTCIEIGGLLFGLRRFEAALAYWRKAAELAPGVAAGPHNAATALRKLRRNDEAAAEFRRAIAVDPRRADSYTALAQLYRDERRFDEALGVYQELLRAVPGSPDAIGGIALVHEAQGKVDEAYEAVRPLIESGTRHGGVVAAYALVCHRLAEPQAGAVDLLRRHLARSDLAPADRRRITLGLANLCDVLERHEEAFRAFEAAHGLERVSEEATKSNLATPGRQRRAYTAARLAALPRADHGSELPLFIVGMPRSGTTLAEQILASHPQVHGAGELTQVGRLATGTLGTGVAFPECLDLLTRDGVNELARGCLEHLRSLAPGASRVVDKMPMNFLHLGLIELLFPRARVIHCVRHPLDTCLSIYFNEFTEAMAFTKSLDALGAYYREYRRLMQYWQRVLKLPLFELRYEALVADPEPVTRGLLEFCGLPWNDACLRFHESRRVVATPSYHQVRKPIYTRSVGRYRAYERFLGPLEARLGELAHGA